VYKQQVIFVCCVCTGLDARAKARHALSLIERLRVLLVANSASATSMLQPTAYTLARALEVRFLRRASCAVVT
jgi:hypothetical protein